MPKYATGLPVATAQKVCMDQNTQASPQPDRDDMHAKLDGAQLPSRDQKIAGKRFIESAMREAQSRMHEIVREMTMEEYVEEVLCDPDIYVRNAAQYIIDALEYWGVRPEAVLGRPIKVFEAMNRPWDPLPEEEREVLRGQESAVYDFYNSLKLMAAGERPNRFVLMHGPPGSGKTLMIRTIIEAIEYYSKATQEGAQYSIVWKFPSASKADEVLGFSTRAMREEASQDQDSDSSDEQAYYIRTNTDPLFLFSNLPAIKSKHAPIRRSEKMRKIEAQGDSRESPREALIDAIEESIRDEKSEHPCHTFNRNYLRLGRLDTSSQMIIEQLLQRYDGDLQTIFKKHVVVRHRPMSRRRSEGLVYMRPVPDSTAQVSALKPRSPYDTPEPVPDALGPDGGDILGTNGIRLGAHRGLLHMTDFAKLLSQELVAFLLETVEGTDIPVSDGRTKLLHEQFHALMAGDCNDKNLAQVTQNPAFEALHDRTEYITVPLIRQASKEQQVHEAELRRVRLHSCMGPHALRVLSLFFVASRTIKPRKENYDSLDLEDEEKEIAAGLKIIEKVLLLDGARHDEINLFRSGKDKLNKRQIKLLQRTTRHVAEEHMKGLGSLRFALYDGGLGISTRAAGKKHVLPLILEQAERGVCVLDVIRWLRNLHGGRAEALQEAEAVVQRMRDEWAKENHGKDYMQLGAGEKREFDKLMERFPLPNGSEIIHQLSHLARKLVERDVQASLGLVDTDKSKSILADYFVLLKEWNRQHRSSILTHGSPRDRAAESARAAALKSAREGLAQISGNLSNEDLMKAFENMFGRLEFINKGQSGPIGDHNRKDFRRALLMQLGDWCLENRERASELEDAEQNSEILAEVFPDIIEKILDKQAFIDIRVEQDLLELSRMYGNKDGLHVRHKESGDPELVEKARRWEKQRAALCALGYPMSRVSEHIEWAIGDKIERYNRLQSNKEAA